MIEWLQIFSKKKKKKKKNLNGIAWAGNKGVTYYFLLKLLAGGRKIFDRPMVGVTKILPRNF